LVKFVENWSNLLKIGQICWKWVKCDENWSNLLQFGPNCLQMGQNFYNFGQKIFSITEQDRCWLRPLVKLQQVQLFEQTFDSTEEIFP
jgi:hypothetical protein